jgi:hypothetical protein
MFLPNLDLFVKLCGASSVGNLVLGKEVRAPQKDGGNQAKHRILRDILAGKAVSKKRLLTLMEAFREHWLKDENDPFPEKLYEVYTTINDDNEASTPSPDQAVLDLWYGIYSNMPADELPRTREGLYNLLVASQQTNKLVQEEGPHALFRKLNAPGDPFWGTWFGFAVHPLEHANAIPDDIAEAFAIMGLLSLALVFWVETVENVEQDRERQELLIKRSINLFFAIEDGQAHPNLAVSNILETAYKQSEFKTKTEFIEKAFGNSKAKIRDAYKFLSGKEIPTFDMTKKALLKCYASGDYDPKDHNSSIIMAQLMARSYRHLNKLKSGAVPDKDKPHFLYFDQLNRTMQARLGGEPAPTNSTDQ